MMLTDNKGMWQMITDLDGQQTKFSKYKKTPGDLNESKVSLRS
jgi:hypothetical protein